MSDRACEETAVRASIERLAEHARKLGQLRAMQPEAWHEIDLTMTQLKALLFIRARQPLSVGKVGEALDVRLGAASALMNRLARFDLVSRRENPLDRRQTLVELTPSGAGLLARIDAQSNARLRQFLDRMSPRGLRALEIALEDMVRALQAEENEDRRGDDREPEGTDRKGR
jgi:DNA-binding MarR family transcriptional regulator